jgi:hypothetical protein
MGAIVGSEDCGRGGDVLREFAFIPLGIFHVKVKRKVIAIYYSA